VAGRKLGNLDVMYDPTAVDEITVGQLAWRDTRSYFDVWTSFPSKTHRKDPSSHRQPLSHSRTIASMRPFSPT
jgi:hypothetical protein